MIPRWLAGYSLGDLMQIAAGVMIYLGSGITLLENWQGKDRPPLPVILVGFLWGGCYMIASVLHTKPQWTGLSHVLTFAGSGFAVIWSVLVNRHSRRKRATVPSPQPAAPAANVWPPPPAAPGEGQP